MNNINSLGNKIATTEEQLKKFWQWFGDSKVVDENGNPLVVYHGTNKIFDKFRKGKSGYLGGGIYLTNEKYKAKRYTNYPDDIMQLYASIKNPLYVNTIKLAQEILYTIYGSDKIYNNRLHRLQQKMDGLLDTQIINKKDIIKLQDLGYDGIIWNVYGELEINVFNPSQIKSVNNNGNWSSSTDNINEQINEEIDNILKLSNTEKKQINEEYVNLYSSYEEYMNKYNIWWVLDYIEFGSNIWNPRINPNTYEKILADYTKYGYVNEYAKKHIEKWVDIILKNSAIFETCQNLHCMYDYVPLEEVYDFYYGDTSISLSEYIDNLYENKIISNKNDTYSVLEYILNEYNVYEKIKLPDGSDSCSDMQGYEALMEEFDECETYEDYLVQINKVLDVWHHRGDLSSMFIIGGRDSLTKITFGSQYND